MLKQFWPYIVAMVCVIGGISEVITGYRGPTGRSTISLALPQPILTGAFSEREIECLTRVVYNESRNQAELGQRLVAATVINRSLDARWKSHDLCTIATQPRQFAHGTPTPSTRLERQALQRAAEVAREVTSNYGALDEQARSFVFFNSGKAKPGSVTIGDHHFSEEYV